MILQAGCRRAKTDMVRKIRVAILGTGNIGSDLAERLLTSAEFELVAAAGRRPDSPGLQRLESRVPVISSSGLPGLAGSMAGIEGFFDATSASDHRSHWDELSGLGKWVIDLTPSKIGKATVPALASGYPLLGYSATKVANYSMVTCGGQSSAPLVAAMAEGSAKVTDIEVSSSISSDSAGPATRRNIDNYIDSTESLASGIAQVKTAKAMLVLNPAIPPPLMRTTVTVTGQGIDIDRVQERLDYYVSDIQRYVPGYRLAVRPHFLADQALSATASVEGEGFFLPKHAGNLDIINAAAVEVARQHAALFGGQTSV